LRVEFLRRRFSGAGDAPSDSRYLVCMGKAELKIDADLLARAKHAGLPVEEVAEQALRAALRLRSAGMKDDGAKWVEENADALEDYNRRIAERGLIGEEFRKW
jgi:post-segregation antitoxin (ccd killing protein)